MAAVRLATLSLALCLAFGCDDAPRRDLGPSRSLDAPIRRWPLPNVGAVRPPTAGVGTPINTMPAVSTQPIDAGVPANGQLASAWGELDASVPQPPLPAPYALQFEPVELSGFDFGAELRGASVGDFDSDGRSDIIVSADAALHTLRQMDNRKLQLEEPVFLSIAASARRADCLVVGDFNADGRDDVAVNLQREAAIAYQTKQGSFEKVESYPLHTEHSREASRLARGDFNGDDKSDLVSIDWGSESQYAVIALQTAGGGLMAAFEHVIPHDGFDNIAVGDVNGDGRDDLVLAGLMTNVSCAVVFQTAEGGFEEARTYLLDIDNTNNVAVGDVTGDGVAEIVFSYGGNLPFVGVLRLDRKGEKLSFTSYQASGISGPAAIADLNADGRNDVVVYASGYHRVSVFMQDAAGSLLREQAFRAPSGNSTESLAVADLDGDERADILLAGQTISVLYQRAP